MKKRKIASLFLASAMTMSMLAGCGSSDDGSKTTAANNESQSGSEKKETEKVTLKVWVPEEEMAITEEMCKAFDEAYEEYDCTFEIAVVGVDEAANNLTTDPDAAADVFQIPSGSISQLKDAGLLYPITADSENVMKLYGEGALEACTRDGYLYGIPFTPNSFFMFYNKDLYTEEEVKNLDTMMAKDLGADVYNFSYTFHDSWYVEAFFYAAGCTLYGEDGTNPDDCTWNNAGGVAAGEYIIDLVNNPKFIEDRDGIAGSLMKEGKLGALCSGVWSAEALREALGDKLGACALPTIKLDGKDCQLSNFADYKCFSVKTGTKHPMAAQLLAEWLGNEENQLKRYQTPESGATPTCLSLVDSPELQSDVGALGLLAQTQYATPQPTLGQIANYWSPVAAFGEEILNGTVTKANLQEKLDAVVAAVTGTLTE